MARYKALLLLIIAPCFHHQLACAQRTPQLGTSSVKAVVKAMTLEEKAAIVCGTSSAGYEGEGTMGGKTFKMVAGAAGVTVALEKYGIPHTVMADGPAGLRIDPKRNGEEKTFYCTAFPIGTMLASSWDIDLIEKCGAAIGNEILEYGCDVILGPGLNIHRNPMCGRNFEYYSEDPLLSGKCAAAMIRGIQSQGVGTSAKHFAANNQESCRIQNNAIVSERALREIYLKSFEIAVKEGRPWTVMSSYNRLNGSFAMENHWLLTEVLRGDWEYEGMVVSDWFGKRNTTAQIHAGNDLLMPGESAQIEEIVDGVKSGSLKEEELDICVERVLKYIIKTPHFKKYRHSDAPDLEKNARTSAEAAEESCVLLKNENKTLPLRQESVVSLFGVNAYDGLTAGIGAGYVNTAYKVNLDQGLRNCGVILNPSTDTIYRKYMDYSSSMLKEENARKRLGKQSFPVEAYISNSFIQSRVAESDVAIISFGRISGEYNDRYTKDFYLHDDEMELLKNVCQAFHSAKKNVIVILNVCGVVETASWKELPDAILINWLPGQELGNATASVLTGRKSPSGRLPMTFPVDYMDHASSANFPFDYTSKRSDWEYDAPERQIKNLGYTEYAEGIDIGYRYFVTKASDKISYPFGFGLNYSEFDWSDASVSRKGDTFTISVKVTNIGRREGKDVVQLYVTAPESGVYKPAKELKAFAKTKTLAPGQSQVLTMELNVYDLASYDERNSSFVTEEGTYKLLLSRNVMQQVKVMEITLKRKQFARMNKLR